MNICKCPGCTSSVLSEFDDKGDIRENGDYCFKHHPNQVEVTLKIYNYIYTHDKIVGLNASGITFSGINFSNKRFYGCNFRHCFFTNIKSTGLRSRMSIFDFAIFTDCNLLKSNMQFTSFAGSKFIHVLFTGSDMIHDNFSGLSSIQSSFDDSDLYNSRFIKANLADTSFRNCNLKKTIFYEIVQTNVSFKLSNTKEAVFDKCGSDLFKGIDTVGLI